MEVTKNKELEKLVDRMMSDATLESPSLDFTSKVMSQVLSTKTSNSTVYKPLISKSVFMAVFGSVFLLFFYVINFGKTTTESWFTFFNYSKLYNNWFLSNFTISKISMYAVVVLMIMFCIQIATLKNHFDKRFEV